MLTSPDPHNHIKHKMANRRMFSNRIIGSARFLKMPVDSQCLYFHLGIHADDDGIVEAYPVMKNLGSSEDNLRVLAAKNFVKILNDDLVSFIMDWNEHNLIRADRKIDSVYKGLLLSILPDVELKEPKPRADTGVIPRQVVNTQPLDNHWTTTGQHRLGKVRLGKVRLEKNNFVVDTTGKEIAEVIFLFKGVNPSIDKFYANKTQRAAVERMLKLYGRVNLEKMIIGLPEINQRKYWPKSTTPLQLEDNLGKYKALNDEEKVGKSIIGMAL